MAEAFEDPMPSLDAVRRQVLYLMDRRGISHGKASAMVREARSDLTLHQSTITRFLGGSDLSYDHLSTLWNVLIEAQALSPDAPITQAIVPKQRIIHATPSMTSEDLKADLIAHDIDYAPWFEKGKISGVFDVRLAHENLGLMGDGVLSDLIKALPEALVRGPPQTYRAHMTVQEVKDHMAEAMKEDPTKALALVKKGRSVLGLVTPYNFLGVT